MARGKAGNKRALYLYVLANPLMMVDPDGRDGEFGVGADGGGGMSSLGGIGQFQNFSLNQFVQALGTIGKSIVGGGGGSIPPGGNGTYGCCVKQPPGSFRFNDFGFLSAVHTTWGQGILGGKLGPYAFNSAVFNRAGRRIGDQANYAYGFDTYANLTPNSDPNDCQPIRTLLSGNYTGVVAGSPPDNGTLSNSEDNPKDYNIATGPAMVIVYDSPAMSLSEPGPNNMVIPVEFTTLGWTFNYHLDIFDRTNDFYRAWVEYTVSYGWNMLNNKSVASVLETNRYVPPCT